MIAEVRRRLDEVVPHYWDDADLDMWLAEAAANVARRTETLETLVVLPIVAGQVQYALPPDLLRLHIVLYASVNPDYVRPLQYVATHSFTPQVRSGEPYGFSLWGKALTLDRPPSRDTFMYVAYYQVAGTNIPAGWDDLLLDYCEMSALRKDRDPRWQEAKALFEHKLSLMIDTTRSWTDDLSRIMEEGGEFYFAPGIVVPVTAGWDASMWDEGRWDESVT